MDDTAGTSTTSASGGEHPRRRFFRRAAVAAAIAGVTAGLGIKVFAHADGARSWRHGGFLGAALDPAMVDEHLDRMLRHL